MSPQSTSRREFLGRGLAASGLAAAAAGLGPSPRASAAAPQQPAGTAAPAAGPLIDRAVAFLRPRQDAKGGWSTQREPGVTALVAAALLRSGQVPPADPTVEKALRYLEGFLTDKGGLSEVPHANYATAISLIAFKYANVNGRYDRTIRSGQEFLKRMQWDESEGKPREDVFYGGAGYGGSNSRPDLSNTAFFIDALHDTGLPPDDPALKKALVFVSRCQNLKSEFNDQPWAGKVNDGGFIYTAAQGGTSVAGKDDSGGLRSYASMTYAGLKSMIYAGLTKDDPRVKAATEFIARHYSLDENPGLGQVGLYYYYHTFAKTMNALDSPAFEGAAADRPQLRLPNQATSTFTDASGRAHDWRAELVAALAKRQQPDGSWVNQADRFMEGDPNLVTAYAILALAYTRAGAKG
ncbi:Prenyltransferase and squalene oxidase repeat protein [Aquisphaera giovannonii]|uniref:Prenyltransferase and squalene oxidase repeat protein n=1 Tax=Aquisphaera giovannonii TaxID=406548 RepID=A0A5B9VUV9_9BACT|nr:prenyltransferase/squalene oxidase repeat-containing protein [Aquisphaera giovannonii]QEH32173.1 Prenyltransferase and squalene oxidase repeat protein [Aquisphaera giovannonii]